MLQVFSDALDQQAGHGVYWTGQHLAAIFHIYTSVVYSGGREGAARPEPHV